MLMLHGPIAMVTVRLTCIAIHLLATIGLPPPTSEMEPPRSLEVQVLSKRDGAAMPVQRPTGLIPTVMEPLTCTVTTPKVNTGPFQFMLSPSELQFSKYEKITYVFS